MIIVNCFYAIYNMTQYQDGLSDTSAFNFNAGTNTLHSVVDGNGATTTFGYQPPGSQNQYYPMNQVDPQGHQTDYAYDSNGNLQSATNHKTGQGLSYNYNSNGTIQNETDADGNVTSFTYDPQTGGNLIAVTPPSPLGAVSLTFDPQTSRVKSVTDGNGNKTSYIYDAIDRIKSITYNGATTISYNYDADGNLQTLVDNTGTTTFKYDALNRITKKTLPDGTNFLTSYDPTDNLTGFTDGSESIVYKYDKANRMYHLLDNGALTIYTYDKANRKTMIQYPNGTGMVIAYDKAGHETSNVGGTMDSKGTILTTYDSFTYTYQKGTAQTALVQTATLLDPINWQTGTTYTRNYTYDNQNRLQDVDVVSNNVEVQKWTYGYDPNGNRTSYTQMSPNVSISYTYTGGNEIQSETQNGTTINFSFDGNGNQTGETGGQSLAYNGKEQTKSIESNTYTYSGPTQQDRVNINSTTLDYSGLGLSQQADSTGTTYFTRCSCGLLNNERIPNGSRYYYLFDGLGSVVGMTSDSGNKVNSYDYDPYGVMLNQVEKTGVNNPFKFAGGYLDASGYYQFGVRYYDPTLGRWTQQDPVTGSLGDLSSADRYVYANDDPVNQVKSRFLSLMADFSQKTLSTLFSFPVIIVVALAPGLLFALGFALIRSGLHHNLVAKVWRRQISWNTYCMFIIGSIVESIAAILFVGILIEDVRFTGTFLNIWALVLVGEIVFVALFYLSIFITAMRKLEKGLREDGWL